LAHATQHVICPLVLTTWEVMGAKHDKVEKKQGKCNVIHQPMPQSKALNGVMKFPKLYDMTSSSGF